MVLPAYAGAVPPDPPRPSDPSRPAARTSGPAGSAGPPGSATPSDAEVAALAARIRGLPPRCGEVVVVAVDGPSGSGKTTFAERVVDRLHDVPGGVAVVHVDDLHTGWDGLDAGVPRLVEGVLRPLARGRPAQLRRWDWDRDAEGPVEPVPAARVLLVEGVGGGARACTPFLSLLVWLDGPEPVRRDRALARDGATYAPNWERWAAQERVHFAREGTAQRADIAYSVGTVAGPG